MKKSAAPALSWTQKLAGVTSHRSELDWLGPDGAQVHTHLGAGAVAWAVEVGGAIATKIGDEIPQLVQGVSEFAVLRRATTSTTLRSLILAAGIGQSDTSLASVEVIEIAQDFARRGLQLNDLLRSTRVGYAVLASALLDAVIANDPRDTTELRRVSVLMFEMMDSFTAVAATAFLDEQRVAEDHLAATRLDLARTIVRGESVDAERASRLLDYPLGADHVAVIASTDHPRTSGYTDLRAAIDPVLGQLGPPVAKLVIPVGAQGLWAWSAYPTPPSFDDVARLPTPRHVNIALGQAGRGIGGFRRSHQEALAVDRLRLASKHPREGLIIYSDVQLEALLLADDDAGRHFARRQLGPLAGADPRATELRHTLKLYFDQGRSLSKVAAIKHISRNTVTYRVQQALQLCGHQPEEGTAKLYAAILITEWLDHSKDQP